MNPLRSLPTVAIGLLLSLTACEKSETPPNRVGPDLPGSHTPVETNSNTNYNANRNPNANYNYNNNSNTNDNLNTNTNANYNNPATNPRTPMDQSQSSGDVKITAEIRRAIMDDKSMSVNAQNCKIITDKSGLVTLHGVVNSQAEKDSIEAKAAAVAGVTKVDNQLEVKATN